MKKTIAYLAAALTIGMVHANPVSPAGAAASARADIEKTFGFLPQFFADFPDLALPGTWEEMKGLQMNPKTALSGKVKELIGLGVASQIPCTYCIDGHVEFAKLNGANKAELGEAVATAALARHWSTVLNGIQTDEGKFRREIAKVAEHAKKLASGSAPAPKPMAVTDGQSALKDAAQYFGTAPEFLKRFPEAGRAGAWRTFKDVLMDPGAALEPKHKDLISLAVASQVPCKFCVIADTEFAKMNGATEAEINEAIAMAAFTRHMSTLLNGMQVDVAQFRRDLNRLVKGAQTAAAAAKSK